MDLSNFYLDIAKDRLYISAADSFRRRSCQTILHIALENLVRAIAPVLCHTAEDIWQFIPYSRSEKSVFQAGWVKIDPQWKNPELENKWHTLRMLRTDVNKVLEQVRMEKKDWFLLGSKNIGLHCQFPFTIISNYPRLQFPKGWGNREWGR